MENDEIIGDKLVFSEIFESFGMSCDESSDFKVICPGLAKAVVYSGADRYILNRYDSKVLGMDEEDVNLLCERLRYVNRSGNFLTLLPVRNMSGSWVFAFGSTIYSVFFLPQGFGSIKDRINLSVVVNTFIAAAKFNLLSTDFCSWETIPDSSEILKELKKRYKLFHSWKLYAESVGESLSFFEKTLNSDMNFFINSLEKEISCFENHELCEQIDVAYWLRAPSGGFTITWAPLISLFHDSNNILLSCTDFIANEVPLKGILGLFITGSLSMDAGSIIAGLRAYHSIDALYMEELQIFPLLLTLSPIVERLLRSFYTLKNDAEDHDLKRKPINEKALLKIYKTHLANPQNRVKNIDTIWKFVKDEFKTCS